MAEFGVSRTVVREALSKLQASGLVETRHGIGTFVVGFGDGGAVSHRARAVGDAARRDRRARTAHRRRDRGRRAWRRSGAPRRNLREMRAALDAFAAAIEAGRDAVAPDFQFHLEIARATQNPHFAELMATLGAMIIPRARLDAPGAPQPTSAATTCGASTANTRASSTPSPARTARPRARRCAPTWPTAASGGGGPANRAGAAALTAAVPLDRASTCCTMTMTTSAMADVR